MCGGGGGGGGGASFMAGCVGSHVLLGRKGSVEIAMEGREGGVFRLLFFNLVKIYKLVGWLRGIHLRKKESKARWRAGGINA